MKEINLELSNSENQRQGLHEDCMNLNKKIITLEEELYESKQIQLELLENLNTSNEKFDLYVKENEEMIDKMEEEWKQKAAQIEQEINEDWENRLKDFEQEMEGEFNRRLSFAQSKIAELMDLLGKLEHT